MLGANATETTIKRLNDQGRLAQYRVLHFATHGTLAGEIAGSQRARADPDAAAEQTETDDGYLSASEVAALKLDADWVILSACNTAAGGAARARKRCRAWRGRFSMREPARCWSRTGRSIRLRP